MYNNIAIIGSAGAIGKAMIKQLALTQPNATIHAFSRKIENFHSSNIFFNKINYEDEHSIINAAFEASKKMPLDMVLVTTGILHENDMMPEKTLVELSSENLNRLFLINTIVPTLIAKYFLPKMIKDRRSVFAALSARVGSISDNKLGGWYSYRASKAALNMIIKNLSIEMGRKYKEMIIVGLHPGTVKSNLSKPFQHHIPKGKLFSPEYSAEMLLKIVYNLTVADSGKCFAWDGKEVLP